MNNVCSSYLNSMQFALNSDYQHTSTQDNEETMATVAIKKYCKRCGCTAFATQGNYCEKHYQEFLAREKERIRRAEKRNHSYAYLYGCSAWKRIRKAWLIEHPLCERCGAPATDVDHIIPHDGDRALFFDQSNYQSLCHRCHSYKTYHEDGAFGRKPNKINRLGVGGLADTGTSAD